LSELLLYLYLDGSRHWAVAVPAFVMVAVALSLLAYLGSNFLATPPLTSFNTIFGSYHCATSSFSRLLLLMNVHLLILPDEYSRERATVIDAAAEEEEAERPIEPISDISIHHINSLMFPN
jgi:phosphatidylinositol glycan class P protein